MELKKIGVLSLGRIAAIFGFLISLISVILLSVASKLQSNLTAEAIAAAGMSEIQLTFSSAIIAIVYSTLSAFIWAIVAAFLYNLLAKQIGGIQLELVDKKKK